MLNTQISPDVAALVATLIASKSGDIISYDDLTKSVGRDVKVHRWLALRALDVAARDHGAVFANERGKGYVRLDPSQAHSLGHTARARVRRTTRKAAKTIRYALQRQNDIDPETARKTNAELSVLGLLEHISGNKYVVPNDVHETRAEPVAITAQRVIEQMK